MSQLGPEEQRLRAEKERARELRASAWWKNQLHAGRCYYCQQRVPPAELTLDHKTPLSRGGQSTRRNVVPACKSCNSEKKYLSLEEWGREREQQGRPLPCLDRGLE